MRTVTRKRLTAAAACVLVVLGLAAAGIIFREVFNKPKHITAYFTTATAIYPSDDVRVAGVKVGHIVSIEPQGTQAKIDMTLDRDVAVPADARAVVVSMNLVGARYVQFAADPKSVGPVIQDGAVIPLERTAVPVEWDEVKEQLTRLATDLGPTAEMSSSSAGRFIESAANAMDGNGDKLRQTLAQLSGVGRILANGSGNIVDTIKNLQTFVTALRDSNVQIVQFQNRLATLTSVLNDSRSDLDSALVNLSEAVGEVQRFIANSRDQTSENVQRLASVTQTLVDHRRDIEQLLHIAPNQLANGYMVFNPQTGGGNAVLTLNNFSNPEHLICGAIAAVADVTAPETSKLCSQYLGPALRLPNLNMLPIPQNPLLARTPPPEDLIYTDPALAPGGAGPTPVGPDFPPAVSAYTGLAPTPSPPASLQDMLLPAEAPPPTGPDTALPPSEGTPPS